MITTLLAWFLMSYGLMNIMVYGSIFKGLRNGISNIGDAKIPLISGIFNFISGILGCPMCFSTWGGFFLGLFIYSPSHQLFGTNEMIAQRKRVVQVAMNKARRKASGQAPVNLTSVPKNLSPTFSKNRIVVNSSETMSSATGTGIDALDDINDYDAPEIREFFISADGGFTKGIDLGSIALGALLTVGFIYLNKQYKWIKL